MHRLLRAPLPDLVHHQCLRDRDAQIDERCKIGVWLCTRERRATQLCDVRSTGRDEHQARLQIHSDNKAAKIQWRYEIKPLEVRVGARARTFKLFNATRPNASFNLNISYTTPPRGTAAAPTAAK